MSCDGGRYGREKEGKERMVDVGRGEDAVYREKEKKKVVKLIS